MNIAGYALGNGSPLRRKESMLIPAPPIREKTGQITK
jgi:hypothetical protein